MVASMMWKRVRNALATLAGSATSFGCGMDHILPEPKTYERGVGNVRRSPRDPSPNTDFLQRRAAEIRQGGDPWRNPTA